MRKSGEGSIVKRRDGLWQASLQKDGVRRTVYGKTAREARTKLRDIQRQAESDGALPDAGNRTVSDLIEEWLTGAPNLKQSTIAQYRMFFDTYVRAPLGDVRIEKVTPDRLQRLYTALTPSVTDRVHRMLHRAFAVAVLWRWLPSNPCDRVLKPAYKSNRPNLWTRAELQSFLDNTSDDWLYPLFVLLLGTGVRLGEALALKWDNIGLGVAIYVDGTLHRLDGEPVVTAPKTSSAVRSIVVPSEVTSVLLRQKAQQDTWRENAGSEWQEMDFVFTGRTGKPLHRSVPAHALKRLCERLNLPHITPHGLRHLHASLLLDEGMPVTAVSARLGHANPNITLKVYAHALTHQDAEAAQAIGRALAPPSESRTRKGDEIERRQGHESQSNITGSS